MDHVLLLKKSVTIKKVNINGYYIYEPVYAYKTGNTKGEKDMPLEVKDFIGYLVNDILEIFNLFIKELEKKTQKDLLQIISTGHS